MTQSFSSVVEKWVPLAVLGVTVFLGIFLRVAFYDGAYLHYDEPITTGVVSTMREKNNLDTNWEHCAVPPEFRYPQFNFSSFHIAAFLFHSTLDLVPAADIREWSTARQGLLVYRMFSVVMASAALFGVFWLSRLANKNVWIAAGAVALTATAPILVQDAHYGRPESFVTALFLFAVIGAWPRERFFYSAVLGSSLAFGLLIASKVSFLPLAWVPIVPVLIHWRRVNESLMQVSAKLVGVAAGVGLGFFVGAPAAALNPRQFLYGFGRLQTQYSGGHPPFSHADGSAMWDVMIAYFGSTFGWLAFLSTVIGIAVLIWERRFAVAALLGGPLLMTAVLFGKQKIFFERNLSHVVPLGIILAMLGLGSVISRLPRKWLRVALAALLGIAVLWVPASISIRLVTHTFSGKSEAELDNKITNARTAYPESTWITTNGASWGREAIEATAKLLTDGGNPVLLHEISFGDEWTAQSLEEFKRAFDVTLLADQPSDYPELPTCTLQVYLSPWHRIWLARAR